MRRGECSHLHKEVAPARTHRVEFNQFTVWLQPGGAWKSGRRVYGTARARRSRGVVRQRIPNHFDPFTVMTRSFYPVCLNMVSTE